jgi:periplasmic divalent cation tolerance protein
MSQARIVLTTVEAREHAETLAQQLLEKRMAACVNIVGPIRSVYRWRGQVEHADEHLLIIKTTAERAAQMASVLKTLHPYDLPECVEVAIPSGSKEYLDWLAASVSDE